MTKYVIIGGDAAGMSAAMTIVRTDKNADIWAFEKGDTFSYAQCGLPYYIGGLVPDSDDLVARTEEQFNEKYGINAHALHEVTAIDPNQKIVTVKDLSSDKVTEHRYDKLLIGTGATPFKPEWAMGHENGVFFLKTMQDAKKIKAYMDGNQIKKAVIVGAGYIGLEMTEALVEQNIDVTVIQKGKHVGGGLDPDMTTHIEDYLHQKINLRMNEEVQKIEESGSQFILSTDKDTYHADIIIVAIGVKPNSQIAEKAGIKLHDKGAIIVNPKMETNVNGIFAAGDCAVQYHRLKGKNDYIPLGTHANKQGKIAGANMAGEDLEFAGVIGTAIFKILELDVARTGLNEQEAQREGISCKSVQISANNHASYYPGAKKMHVKLVFKENGQLLGGQFIGRGGIDKQVDVLATALHYELTVPKLLELDLSYAPPYSSTWSPLQQAARVALKKL